MYNFGHFFGYRCFNMILFIELINEGTGKNKQLKNTTDNVINRNIVSRFFKSIFSFIHDNYTLLC